MTDYKSFDKNIEKSLVEERKKRLTIIDLFIIIAFLTTWALMVKYSGPVEKVYYQKPVTDQKNELTITEKGAMK